MAERQSFWQRWFRPFSRGALFRVGALLLPLAVLLFASKLHKYLRLQQAGFVFSDLYPLLHADLLLLFCIFGAFALWLDRVSGWFRSLGAALFHLGVLVLTLVVVLEHAYFVHTGVMGGWSLLRYALMTLGSLWTFFWSRLTLGQAALVGFLLFLNILPYRLERRPWLATWLERRKPLLFGNAFEVGFLVLFFLLAFFPPTRPLVRKLRPLKRNVALHIAKGMHKEFFGKKRKMATFHNKKLFDAASLRFSATKRTKRWNVVFLVLESMRARSTTIYDARKETTPFMASLSENSLLVEWMYPVVPHTTKALVSLLCGVPPQLTQYPYESEELGLPVRCLPRLLKDLDYQSAFFQPATRYFENRTQLIENMGFDTFRSHEDLPTKSFSRVSKHLGYEDRVMLAPSMRWVDQMRKKKRPFFLTYLTLTSHFFYNLPKNFPARKLTNAKDPLLHRYLNTVRYTDDFVRRVLSAFRKRGLLKSTIFVIVGDHGEAFLEHKRRFHSDGAWEEFLRVPAMIYHPARFPRGRLIRGARQHSDLVPTIAQLLGVQMRNGHLPGKSLLTPVSPKRPLYFGCWSVGYCLAKRLGDKKYIYNFKRAKGEVYDLRQDPMEKRNLIDQKLHAKAWPALTVDLLRWRDHVNFLYKDASSREVLKRISLSEPSVQVSLNVDFAPYLRLVGYNLRSDKVALNRQVDITYVFQVRKKIPKGWSIFYHGYAVNQRRDKRRYINFRRAPFAGTYPLHEWVPGHYIRDRQVFQLRPRRHRLRPGMALQLHIGVWKSGIGRLPLKHTHGRPHIGRSLLVAEIQVQ